jgi:hypothetical protein
MLEIYPGKLGNQRKERWPRRPKLQCVNLELASKEKKKKKKTD